MTELMANLTEQNRAQMVEAVLTQVVKHLDARDAETKKGLILLVMQAVESMRSENQSKEVVHTQRMNALSVASDNALKDQELAKRLMHEATSSAKAVKDVAIEHAHKTDQLINLMDNKVDVDRALHGEMKQLMTNQSHKVDTCCEEVSGVTDTLKRLSTAEHDHTDCINQLSAKVETLLQIIDGLEQRVNFLEMEPAVGVPALHGAALFPPSPSVMSGTPSAPGSAPPPTPVRD